LISEVFYDPSGAEPAEEWIEIYNPGQVSIAMDVYKVGDEETALGGEGMYSFPVGVWLGAGDVLVIANQASAFIAQYGVQPDFELVESDPDVPNLLPYSAWSNGPVNLGNLEDEALLLNGQDQTIDALSWGSSDWAFSPPCPDVVQGHSLERRPANHDTNTASDWVDQPEPAPGQIGMSFIPRLFAWFRNLFS
jgi:hypothetical protein